MKTLSIITLALFLFSCIIQTFAVSFSYANNISATDKIILAGTICGVCLALVSLIIKKHNYWTIVPYLLISLFVVVVTCTEINYWLQYYKDGRGGYSIFFIIQNCLNLISIISICALVLKQGFRFKSIP